MLLSKKWLNQYVQIDDLSSQAIADTLTQLGIEVEGIDEKPSLDPNIVVGEIISAEKHPNADTLQLCQVKVSSHTEENLSIVCGAANARKGIKVAVACVGAKLPDGFKIKKANVRSVPSFGMMCSEKELELSEANEGIMELDSSLTVGAKVSEIYDTSDSIFDLSITPNRSDCLSYYGIARDLSAKLERDLLTPSCSYKGVQSDWQKDFTVEVEALQECNRFAALEIKGYTHTDSPAWLIQALEKNGMRPVSLMVDLTNYVMLEFGQPIHAYDKKTLAGKTLVVKIASEQSSFKTLDDKTIGTEVGDLLITDAEKTVGLAGIMGGLNSEVSESTTDLIIEVAHFSPKIIRKTAKRLALHTDASHRFERGVDCENIVFVMKRLAYLLQKCLEEKGLAPCSIASDIFDHYPKPEAHLELTLRTERVHKLLNLEVSTFDCVAKLESLGLRCLNQDQEKSHYKIPSWRHDLRREVDLIEEVGRLVGFDKIPSEIPKMAIAPGKENPFVNFQEDCKFALASFGLSEVITYPFSSHKDYQELLCSEDSFFWPHIKLQNALNEQESFMQTTLVPSLLKAVCQNRNYGNKAAHLFEVNRGYFDLSKLDQEKHKDFIVELRKNRQHLESNKEKKLVERTYLSGVIDAPNKEKSWLTKSSLPSFFDAKAILEKFFQGINLKDVSWVKPEDYEIPFLHPSAAAKIMKGKTVLGYAGEIHPKVAKNYELGTDIPVVFEIDLENCMRLVENKITVVADLKKFPPVSRDIAFMVKDSVSYADFMSAVNKNPRKKFLNKVSLFDVYQGDNIQEGFKSFASEFVFQAKDKTLSEKDINKEIEALIKHLEQEIEAVQR